MNITDGQAETQDKARCLNLPFNLIFSAYVCVCVLCVNIVLNDKKW